MSNSKVVPRHPPVLLTDDRIDIGGLEDIISSVKETVIYPLVYPDLFRSASYSSFLCILDLFQEVYLVHRGECCCMVLLDVERRC